MITAKIQHDPVLRSFSDLHGRIGIFGGSFDPVTNAHLEVARIVQRAHNLDFIVFMPTPSNPLKDVINAAGKHRFEMLKGALAEQQRFYVSDWELDFQEFVPTSVTVNQIKQLIPKDSSLHFIIGSDCIDTFARWVNVRNIFNAAEVITVTRSELSEQDFSKLKPLEDRFIDHIRSKLVVVPPIPGSSTAVRAAAEKGEDISSMVPKRVADYIAKLGLYNDKSN